jgi:hypothetical protein
MKHRISPATIIASVALFISLGGTSMAAGHWLITSTAQIKPSVLHHLHGARGERGAQGIQGATGATGSQGQMGAQGPQGDPGQSMAGPDWVHSIIVFGPKTTVTTATPRGAAAVFCPMPQFAVTGGFQDSNVDVTGSQWTEGSGVEGWGVNATLAPGETSGTIVAWARCAPLS